MAEPSTHTNYSFEDIQRYLQGDMSAAEMHAIEKAALRDPFLADAIEGFNEVDPATARHHLNEINAGLFREKQRSKIITFNNQYKVVIFNFQNLHYDQNEVYPLLINLVSISLSFEFDLG